MKMLIWLFWIVGVGAVIYGMTAKDNAVFIIGLLLVIAGYWPLRKRLKEAIQRKHGSGQEGPRGECKNDR